MKIDVSKIEGYENMSADEKVLALEAYETEETNSDDKLKKAFTKASSDVAKYKKMLEEKQSEQERLETQRKEKEEALMNELEELRKEKAISANKASFIGAGYSETLAESSAKAMVDGDFAKIFADLKLFTEEVSKKMKQEALNQQPSVSAGKVPEIDKNKEDIAKLMKLAMGN